MAKEKVQKVAILLSKSDCIICGQTFYDQDMESHMQLVHPPLPEERIIDLPTVEDNNSIKAQARQSAARKKWRSHRFEHTKTIQRLKLDGQQLSNSIKLQILNLDMMITQINTEEEFSALMAESKEISAIIEKTCKKPDPEIHPDVVKKVPAKAVPEIINPEVILHQGHTMLQMVRISEVNDEASEKFLFSILGQLGFLDKAKTYGPLLLNEVQRKEYEHTLELIEKITNEKISQYKKPKEPAPEREVFVSSVSEADLKKQYAQLLRKNIQPIIEHLEEEKKKKIAAIRAYLQLNSTSAFTYTFDEKKEEITGSVEGYATIKIPFKP